MQTRDPIQEGFDIIDNPLLDLYFGMGETSATAQNPATAPTSASPTHHPTAPQKGPHKAPQSLMAASFTLATFNIRNTPRMPQAQVIRCGRLLTQQFDLGNAQEIDTPEIEGWFHSGLGQQYTTLGASDNPTYYSGQFRVNKHGSIVMTPAIHLPNFDNPPRSFNWAEMQDIPSGVRFMFVGTHLINGAWNNVDKPYKELRKERWITEYNILQRYCTAFAQTLPVFIVGDLNRYSPVPKMVPRMEWIGNHTDDHIGYIPPAKPVQGTVNLTVGSEHHIKDPSDHLAVTVKVHMEVKP